MSDYDKDDELDTFDFIVETVGLFLKGVFTTVILLGVVYASAEYHAEVREAFRFIVTEAMEVMNTS